MLYMNKETALKDYKEAKKKYLENPTKENWIAFCDAKSVCMRLGIRIQKKCKGVKIMTIQEIIESIDYCLECGNVISCYELQ